MLAAVFIAIRLSFIKFFAGSRYRRRTANGLALAAFIIAAEGRALIPDQILVGRSAKAAGRTNIFFGIINAAGTAVIAAIAWRGKLGAIAADAVRKIRIAHIAIFSGSAKAIACRVMLGRRGADLGAAAARAVSPGIGLADIATASSFTGQRRAAIRVGIGFAAAARAGIRRVFFAFIIRLAS